MFYFWGQKCSDEAEGGVRLPLGVVYIRVQREPVVVRVGGEEVGAGHVSSGLACRRRAR